MTDPLEQLLADLARTSDPRERLRRIAEARVDVTEIEHRYVMLRRSAIVEARSGQPRLKWREIGEIFGVSPQRAEAMSRHEIRTQPERTDQ
jgi:hypothetical protein